MPNANDPRPVFTLLNARYATLNADGTVGEPVEIPKVTQYKFMTKPIVVNGCEYPGYYGEPIKFEPEKLIWTFNYLTPGQFHFLKKLIYGRPFKPLSRRIEHAIRRRLERASRRAARGY